MIVHYTDRESFLRTAHRNACEVLDLIQRFSGDTRIASMKQHQVDVVEFLTCEVCSLVDKADSKPCLCNKCPSFLQCIGGENTGTSPD